MPSSVRLLHAQQMERLPDVGGMGLRGDQRTPDLLLEIQLEPRHRVQRPIGTVPARPDCNPRVVQSGGSELAADAEEGGLSGLPGTGVPGLARWGHEGGFLERLAERLHHPRGR